MTWTICSKCGARSEWGPGCSECGAGNDAFQIWQKHNPPEDNIHGKDEHSAEGSTYRPVQQAGEQRQHSASAYAGVSSGFKKAIGLVKDRRKLIYCVAIALFVMTGIGYLRPNLIGDVPEAWGKSVNQEVEARTAEVEGRAAVEDTVSITANNLRVSGSSVLLGIAFLPVWNLALNGYVLGALMEHVVDVRGPLVLWKLLPHGVFEIPALCIAWAFGLRIGVCWFRKDRIRNFKRTYSEALTVLVFVVLPLLIVAGTIEGTAIWISSL